MGEGNQFEDFKCDFSYGRLSGRCICLMFVLYQDRKSGRRSSYLWIYHAKYVNSPLFFTLIAPLTSLRQPQLENRRRRKRGRPCPNHLFQRKKSDQSWWFFNAFGAILGPNVFSWMRVLCQVQWVSIIYGRLLISNLNSNVRGACGEIVVLKGKSGQNLLNPLIAEQNFEYKMSNVWDKPSYVLISFLSVDFFFGCWLDVTFFKGIGFCTVLPGAFSAYHYIALRNDSTDEGPLQTCFLGESMVISLFLFRPNICWLCCSTAQGLIFLLLTCTSLRIVSIVGNSSLRGWILDPALWNRRTLLLYGCTRSSQFLLLRS